MLYFLIFPQIGSCRDAHVIRVPHILFSFICLRHRFGIMFLDKDYLPLQVVGISIGKKPPITVALCHFGRSLALTDSSFPPFFIRLIIR